MDGNGDNHMEYFKIVHENKITVEDGVAYGYVTVYIRRWHPRWWLLTFNAARRAAKDLNLPMRVWVPLWFKRMLVPRSYFADSVAETTEV